MCGRPLCGMSPLRHALCAFPAGCPSRAPVVHCPSAARGHAWALAARAPHWLSGGQVPPPAVTSALSGGAAPGGVAAAPRGAGAAATVGKSGRGAAGRGPRGGNGRAHSRS